MNEKKIEAAKRQYVHNRNWRRARDRALVKLARMHPDEYRILLKRERALDEEQGKKWIDINGTTIANQLDTRPITPVKHGDQANDNSPHQRNYGGEA